MAIDPPAVLPTNRPVGGRLRCCSARSGLIFPDAAFVWLAARRLVASPREQLIACKSKFSITAPTLPIREWSAHLGNFRGCNVGVGAEDFAVSEDALSGVRNSCGNIRLIFSLSPSVFFRLIPQGSAF